MHPALHHTEHRPWPLPEGRWTWRQTWRDLLFAHWPVPVSVLERLVPAGLAVEAFDGTGWVGVVPFRMTGVARRPLPDLPWISAFPELNVRTYVTRGGKPGVWFFSLDAGNPPAVWAARRFFHLPYHRARMRVEEEAGGWVRYESVRRAGRALEPGDAGDGSATFGCGSDVGSRGESRRPTPRTEDRSRSGSEAPAVFAARYGPTSDPYRAAPDTLEHALTERYCLYAETPDGGLERTEIHHRPWPLQAADAEILRNDLCAASGLECAGPPALLHFSRRIDVVVWPPARVESGG